MSPPADVFAVPTAPRDEANEGADPSASAAVDLEPWKKARKAKGVAAPPAACAAFAHRAPKKDPGTLLDAFAESDAATRDARLVAIAKATPSAAAFSTAARAEFAPTECADAIVDPYLDAWTSASTDSPANVRLVIGFSLAGKLARTASAPPLMGAAADKEKVKAFIQGPLKTWLVEQSTAIELLSSGAAGLSGYARGAAAIEAGIAEMRLVDKMRSAPTPSNWDPELKAIYETVLDESLEPRKKRGRDATLVGMSDFAKLGIVRDYRLDRARALLSKLYGGRRIDALDGLLLPPPIRPGGTAPKDTAMAMVPTAWLDSKELALGHDPHSLARGVTFGLREDFRKADSAPSAEVRSQYARARLDLGRVFWRRVDFVEAATAAKASSAPEDRLVLAVSLALAHGPNGAADMMRAATPSLLHTNHTEALDVIANEGGPLAGLAAYDAAHLRALSPPDNDDAPIYLREVSLRFHKAESLFSDPAQKKLAAQRAGEIDAIVAALAGKGAGKQ